MQVKIQADTADSSKAKEEAKSELESLKVCLASSTMNCDLHWQPEQSAKAYAFGYTAASSAET